jgi:glutathione S-transferase
MIGSTSPRWALVLDRELSPARGAPNRRDYVRWLLYAAAKLKPAVIEAMLVAAKGDTVGLERARRLVTEQARVVEEALCVAGETGEKLHLLGDKLTAADLVVGRVLAWAEGLSLLEPGAKLAAYVAYVARVASRLPR